MEQLINVIMDHLSKVKQRSLMYLETGIMVYLDPRRMDNTQISDVVLPLMIDNHELTFPKFFIISDNVVVAIPFSYLKLSKISIKLNL